MPAYTLAPFPKHQFFDNNGDPLNGGKLFTYTAGTSTKVSTYSDTTGTVNDNPIVLDSAGRCTIYLVPGNYKFVLAPSTDTDPPTSPLWTLDNILSVPGPYDGVMVSDPTLEAGTVDGDWVYLGDNLMGGAGTWYSTRAFPSHDSLYAPILGYYDGAADVVRISGQQTMAGLTAGTRYYLGDTGAIASSPTENYERYVGTAASSTQLLINTTVTRHALYACGYSAGKGNVGTGDDELGDFVVQPQDVTQAGDGFVVEGVLSLAANTNVKLGKIGVGSGTVTTFLSNNANVANHVVPFRLEVRRRTSTSGSVTALSYVGAASAGAPTNYMVNTTLGTLDWTAEQTVRIYGNATSNNDIVLLEMWVYLIRARENETV